MELAVKVQIPYKLVEEDCGCGVECHPPCTGKVTVREVDVHQLKRRYRNAVAVLAEILEYTESSCGRGNRLGSMVPAHLWLNALIAIGGEKNRKK